jgi:putative two-component system response regulator
MTNDTNSRKTILLVDDDEVHLVYTQTLLKDDFDVFMLKSGKEAMEFLGKDQNIPDLILLDILMPEMDGWTVFDQINAIADLKFTPIIFYSSLEEEVAREKAYELGAFDYINKPCKKSVLIDKIKDAIQKAELKKQHYGV